MPTLDWAYLRSGCITCKRAQGFIDRKDATVRETANAKKDTIPGAKALGVLKDIDELYATRGTRVFHLDLKRDKPSREELEKLLIGPSGNLRAPTIRKGRTLLVGFDEATYAKVIK
ncbi:MAG: ArsC family (seleno)protein [Gemmatimonadales bacterium]